MTVTVREARLDEYDAIGELTLAAYAAYPEAAEDEDYRLELRDVAARAASCPIYAAVEGETGRVLGGAMYVPGPGPFAESEREGEAGIRMLAVDPTAQRQGVGRALTNALIDRARADGRVRIALLSLTSMTAAHAMYFAMGFRRAPERDWEIEPGLVVLAFELDL